jgi:hypothetical protein
LLAPVRGLSRRNTFHRLPLLESLSELGIELPFRNLGSRPLSLAAMH